MRVLETALPDGSKFYNDDLNIKKAAEFAKRYLKKNGMTPASRPLTTFTILEMTERRYHGIGASNVSADYFAETPK